jgi:hypothetical protein
MGYWCKGKQHGLGKYLVPNEEKMKYGLWEDGKRIKWFESVNDIQDIMKGQVDYT